VTARDAGFLPDGTVPWLHDLARQIARLLYRPMFRVRVHGVARVPRTGPLVLIANHSTFFEPQLIFGMLPRRSVFFVKAELFAGVLGRGLRAIGQIPVHRGRPDRAPLVSALKVLGEGGLVGVFPEGTRGTGDVSAAEQGAAWLVRNTGAVLLPVASRGTLRRRGRRRFRPVVDLLVGEPFRVSVAPGRGGLSDATEEIRTALAELVADLDRRRGGNFEGRVG
jgi:1-acyl-sn-glycerol-3-phosphate acyltransferase